jgi:4-alpha-glucanotransferase
MKSPRASGILVHPTSFPGRFGVGDLGPGALRVLDFLAAADQTLWQVLPLGPTGYGDSPYALLSAFAGNPLVISPERLIEEGLLGESDLEGAPPFDPRQVDFGAALPWKMGLLHASHARFLESPPHGLREAYEAFCAAEAEWLDDYALFAALKRQHKYAGWTDWPAQFANREPAAMDEAGRTLAGEIDFQRYAQFLFFRQWAALREAARARNISIIGDLAIFVAHDSADVWAHRELFKLDEQGQPTVVAGVPPDYFSETGQRWGNPIYRWDVLAGTGYAWWVARVRQALEMEDIIRLDHFRGFEAYWEIPASDETAVGGKWVTGPRDALFEAIRAALDDVPFIAEDLGTITKGVRQLKQRLGFPGMRVLQFAFGGDARNPYLPHNYTRNSVVYTGTHDNDTTAGWYASLDEATRDHVRRYLSVNDVDVLWAMLRAAQASVARVAIAPLQDVLFLGSEARMNFPSRAHGNWAWRATDDQLSPEAAGRLAELTKLYGRSAPAPKDQPAVQPETQASAG